MEDFFAENDNLNKVFPSWHFLTKQWRISSNKIQDTIIFNPTELSFAIIEYKLDDYNRIQQVLKYLEEMDQEEKENLIEEARFNYYYKNGKRGEKDIYKYKLWKEKPKLILISSLSEKLKSLNQLPNTSIVKIGFMRIEKEPFLYVDADESESELLSPKKRKRKEKIIEKEQTTLKADTKKKIEKLTDYITKFYSFLFRKSKSIFGWRTFYYSDKNGELLFALVCGKEIIKIRLNLQKLAEEKKKTLENKFEFQENKKDYKEEFDSEYIIDNEENFQKSFDLLDIFLKSL